MKRTLLSLLLVLSAVKMKDSQTDRHKRAFWDLLRLQEAASPSKFATWQWWSACLMRWCVSPQVCTQRRTRKHNWEFAQRLESCLTTSLVCLCLCVLRLLSSLSYLFHPLPPLSFCLSLLTGIVGETGGRVLAGNRHHTFPLLCLRSRSMCWVGDTHCRCVTVGGNVDNSLCRHEAILSLGPGCTVFLLSVHPTTVKLCLSLQNPAARNIAGTFVSADMLKLYFLWF